MQDWTPREHYTAEDLVEIIHILRDGENGCPWDKAQTHASIRKNFLEETCEALEAIDADDPVMMQEELGDVLMQVVFHTVIEEERGRFDMEKVCREVCEKLVFRHPNIFASSAAENAGINSWDALKNKEKGRTTLADELDTVPATLPALMRAQKLQKRAARFGCGPEDAAGAARTLDSAKAAWDAQQTAENAGELLLAAADAMRLAGVEGAVVHGKEELKAELDKVLADKTIGIVLLTEKFGREFPELVNEVRLNHRQPLFVEIPDRHGTGRKPDFITAYVNEAIGLKL